MATTPRVKEEVGGGREEAVIGSVQRWLGNPASKAMLRFVCGRSSRGGNRLDIALRRYVGEDVPCDLRDRLAAFVVKLIVKRSSNIFGYSDQNLKKNLRDPVIRRGMVNVLEGIARYGARRPFTSVAPFLVVWNYTKLCNLRCEHCYESAGPKAAEDELTTEEAKRVIDEFEDAGVVAIAFSGGEPLMRGDIFEVAGYAKEKGFFTSVATNGTMITRELARKMKEVFDYAEISLDGFEEVHDRFRGIRGAWRRTCTGIKNCVAEGLDTCVALTATRYNLQEVPKLVDFVEGELGAKRVIIFNYVPVGRGRDIVDQDLSPQERQELLKYLYSRMMGSDGKLICYTTAPQYSMVSWEFAYGTPGATGLVSTHFTSEGAMRALQGRTKSLADFLGGCGAGRLYCGLEPNGDITPCVFIPIKLGNIRKDRLRDIWHSSDLLWKLRNREDLKGCGKCEYRYICGGCRARAYGYFGDVQAPDPGCIYNLRYWQELKNKDRNLPIEVYGKTFGSTDIKTGDKMANKPKSKMRDNEIADQISESLTAFSQEFGKVLEPVAFLKEKNPALCAAFLKLHELTLNDGVLSKKHKFLIHAAITAAQHDREATVMHITGALKAGANEWELLETSFTLIPVSGMPAFAVFLAAWQQARQATTKIENSGS